MILEWGLEERGIKKENPSALSEVSLRAQSMSLQLSHPINSLNSAAAMWQNIPGEVNVPRFLLCANEVSEVKPQAG